MKDKVLFVKDLKHYEGLELKEDVNCKFILTNFRIRICDIKNRELKSIDLKDIVNVGIISDKELIEKDRNVIARGVVGNVLFGGAGLVLGGLSGLQTKKKEQIVDYLIINYKENGEDKVINLYAKEFVLNDMVMKKLNYAIEMSKKDLRCLHCNAEINFEYVRCPKCGKRVNKSNKGKKILIGFIIFVVIVAFMQIIRVENMGNKELDIIMNAISVESEKAEEINNIFEKIGLDNIKEIKADSESLDGFEGVGSKGYRIKNDISDNIILYLDSENNVICIRYADKDYYRNGEVINKF